MKFAEIFELAIEKARNRCCPDCESEHTLNYADDTVLVCSCCDYSIEADELQPEWQEKLEDEYGLDG